MRLMKLNYKTNTAAWGYMESSKNHIIYNKYKYVVEYVIRRTNSWDYSAKKGPKTGSRSIFPLFFECSHLRAPHNGHTIVSSEF